MAQLGAAQRGIADAVARLKQENGGDILVAGSGQLVRTLMAMTWSTSTG